MWGITVYCTGLFDPHGNNLLEEVVENFCFCVLIFSTNNICVFEGYKVNYIIFMILKLEYKLVMDSVLFELWELINVKIPNLYASYSISMLDISTFL